MSLLQLNIETTFLEPAKGEQRVRITFPTARGDVWSEYLRQPGFGDTGEQFRLVGTSDPDPLISYDNSWAE